MRAFLIVGVLCLSAGAASAREFFIAPWFGYGPRMSGLPDDDRRGARTDTRASAGLEALVPFGDYALFGTVALVYIRERPGLRSASLTCVTVGPALLTDRAGRTHWDVGVAIGAAWPGLQGDRDPRLAFHWRIASATRVLPWAALEIASGARDEAGQHIDDGGIFGRLGIRFGRRQPAD